MPRLTVTAIDSPTAMEEIVSKLGEDAVILSTRKIKGKVEISASNDPVPGGLPPRKPRGTKVSKSFTDVFTKADETLSSALPDDGAEIVRPDRQSREHIIDDVIELENDIVDDETLDWQSSNIIDLEAHVPHERAATVQPREEYQALAHEIAQLRRQINGMIVTEATALRHEIGNSLTMRLKTAGFSDAVLERFGYAMQHQQPEEAQAAFINAIAGAVAVDHAQQALGADIFIIVGPHGAGKTSLSAKLAGLLTDDKARVSLASYELLSGNQNTCRNNARLLNLPFIDLTSGIEERILGQNGKVVIDAGADLGRIEKLEQDLLKLVPEVKICRIVALPGAYSAKAIRQAIDLYSQTGAFFALTRLDECEIAAQEFSVLAESHAKLGLLTASRSLVDAVVIAGKEPVAQYLSGMCSVD